ncbi:uncharacterized protein EI90DRAFT_3027478 [Cantharellus anzutake]|uniref:uncharacterized protein n=1 Tax=Cantharellus anzutake TaxID=1750568 RepID=UPI001908312E|nr:uncharacterized protein EI90DRAFT_3027478 [Cantharellus anzutake]KAF8343890.1 hypothetical protein EI90DRAFT_3027478 [Cantharellus anzutake]
MRFYQVGGLRAHFRDIDQAAPLFRKIDGYLELVLGIVESGASYILIPEQEIHRPPGQIGAPVASTHFASLAPIGFTDIGKLKEKLKTLKLNSQKAKNSRRAHGFVRDTSIANNRYTVDFDGSKELRILYGEDIKNNPLIVTEYSDASVHRSAFEHSRVILRCLQYKLKPDLYTIAGPPWTGHVHQIIIFTATGHQYITSGKMDRVALDYGWAEVAFHTGKVALENWTHICVPHLYHTQLQQGEFKGGRTERLVPSSVRLIIQPRTAPT